jgi:hypothetical protein
MKVAWSEPAVADLVAIHDYIARDSPQYAQRFVEPKPRRRRREAVGEDLNL